MRKQAIVVNARDNVATVVDDFTVGSLIHYFLGAEERTLALLQDIPMGHKCAIARIGSGESIVKYGEEIGRATAEIMPGGHVHVHNMESQRGRGDR